MKSKINLKGHLIELTVVDTKNYSIFIEEFDTMSKAGIKVHDGKDVVSEISDSGILGPRLHAVVNVLVSDKGSLTFMGCLENASRLLGFSPLDAGALRNLGYVMFLSAVSEEKRKHQKFECIFDSDVEMVAW